MQNASAYGADLESPNAPIHTTVRVVFILVNCEPFVDQSTVSGFVPVKSIKILLCSFLIFHHSYFLSFGVILLHTSYISDYSSQIPQC